MDREFRKIDLNKTRKSVVKTEKKRFGKLSRRKAIVPILLIILILAGLWSARMVYSRGLASLRAAKETYQALKHQDLEKTQAGIAKTQKNLRKTQTVLRPFFFLKFIPFLGNYYRDGEHLIKAGLYVLEAGDLALSAIEPHADLLGFKGDSSFVEKSTDERIQTAVLTFDKITPELSQMAESLKKAKAEIDPIEPGRYPEKIANFKVRNKITLFKEMADQYLTMFIDARPLLEILPQLLGEPETKTYLVLFQNDKELRPTGGFITAYAILKFDQGKMEVIRSDDIYKLDQVKTKNVGAPPEILRYHKGVYYFNLRDSNLSPDFLVSMKQFEELYDLVSGKIEIDGIIGVDTHVLVEILKVLGPIEAYGREFSSEIDSRCDCPKVVYELEDYATRPVGYLRSERKDIIGVLLAKIMEKALGVSPGQYWGRLFQVGVEQFKEKHILAYFHNQKAQQGIEVLNFGGRIKDYEGDYLHINDTNFAGAKSNMFVKHFVNQEIDVGENGKVVKTITIDYKNPAPPSNCSLESGELCLNGLLRNWLRIYVPQGSKLLEFKGSEKETVVKKELGKTVFEGFLIIKPLGSAQVVVKYQLPFEVKKGEEYRLLIQKQPGTEGHEYKIVVNGKEIERFNLTTDRELKFKI